jgi:hypothetical protein
MRRRSGSNQAALRYTGTVVTTLGNTFGTTESSDGDHTPQNHAVQFQGNIFAVGSDGVYRKDDPTADSGSWTQVHAFTSPDTTNSRFSGLYPVNISGIPSLTMLYGTTTGTTSFRGVKFNGSSWSETAEIAAAAAIVKIKAEIIFRNQLHIVDSAPNSIVWNPSGDTITTVSNTFGNANVGLCVFRNRLFAVHSTGGNAVSSISEFTSGWTIVVNNFSTAAFNATGVFPSFDSGNQCLFTDGTNMYCMVSGLHDLAQGMLTAGEGGWRCFQFDSNLAVTNLTTTVLPANLRADADGGSGGGAPANGSILGPQGDRFFAFTDVDTTPGSQTTWLYYSPSQASPQIPVPANFVIYQWNGSGSVMTQSGVAGGSDEHSVVSLPTSGGEYAWTAGELDVWISAVVADPAGTLISFKASGDPGSADKTVTFRVDYQGEPKITLATLTGSATGGSATRSGDSVINVDADGTTTYTVIWDHGTDVPVDTWRAGIVSFIA